MYIIHIRISNIYTFFFRMTNIHIHEYCAFLELPTHSCIIIYNINNILFINIICYELRVIPIRLIF